MLKKRKVKAIYVTQMVCDDCGSDNIVCTHVLCSYPAQYCYKCRNCGATSSSTQKNGDIEYEFEEEVDICTTLLP